MRLHFASIVAVALGVGACVDATTQPDQHGFGSPRSAALPSLSDSASAQLLVCPTTYTQSATVTIGPAGGWFSVRGSSIAIPPNAVPSPKVFEIVVPASRYMEVEIHAVGVDHYVFAVPATVTINYARCPNDAVPADQSLEGVYIDDTNQVLEIMGGHDDRSSHKVSFSTGHLSGYAVAF
jgi:hypothetical protein